METTPKNRPSDLRASAVLAALRWPQNAAHPVRRYWSPWWVIGWRAIWTPPIYILTVLLCGAVCMGWGRKKAEILWSDIVQ